MLKERIQEVFDFTKSESPYRKANKGWINQDIFLDLSPSSDSGKQINEVAKVTLFWSPINNLLSNIFLIIFLASILVFSSVSFKKGRFDFNLFNNYEIIDIVEVEKNKDLNQIEFNDLDSSNSETKQNLDSKELDKSSKINLLDDDLIKTDQKLTNKTIDKQDILIKENDSKKDIKILEINKPKSNFI